MRVLRVATGYSIDYSEGLLLCRIILEKDLQGWGDRNVGKWVV